MEESMAAGLGGAFAELGVPAELCPGPLRRRLHVHPAAPAPPPRRREHEAPAGRRPARRHPRPPSVPPPGEGRGQLAAHPAVARGGVAVAVRHQARPRGAEPTASRRWTPTRWTTPTWPGTWPSCSSTATSTPRCTSGCTATTSARSPATSYTLPSAGGSTATDALACARRRVAVDRRAGGASSSALRALSRRGRRRAELPRRHPGHLAPGRRGACSTSTSPSVASSS